MANYNDTTDRVLSYIVDYKQTHDGNSPTLEEIACGVGLSRNSKSVIWYHVKKLSTEGRVVVRGVRQIEVVHGTD